MSNYSTARLMAPCIGLAERFNLWAGNVMSSSHEGKEDMVRGVVVQVAAGRLASWKHRAPSRPCPQVGQVGGGVEGTIGPDQLWPLHQQRPGLTGRQATRRNLLQETAYFNQEDQI